MLTQNMLIYIIKALSKGNNLYTDTAFVELLLLFNYDVRNVVSNDVIALLYIYLEFQDYLFTLLLLK